MLPTFRIFCFVIAEYDETEKECDCCGAFSALHSPNICPRYARYLECPHCSFSLDCWPLIIPVAVNNLVDASFTAWAIDNSKLQILQEVLIDRDILNYSIMY